MNLRRSTGSTQSEYQLRQDDENTILLPFDHDYMDGYGQLLDRLDKVANHHNLDETDRAAAILIFDLAIILDMQLNEEFGHTHLTESVMDEVYAHFNEAVANDMIEEITWFVNEGYGYRPAGWDLLKQMYKESEGTLVIHQVIPVREENAMIYTITYSPDE